MFRPTRTIVSYKYINHFTWTVLLNSYSLTNKHGGISTLKTGNASPAKSILYYQNTKRIQPFVLYVIIPDNVPFGSKLVANNSAM